MMRSITPLRIAIIGAGWAGMSAAVRASQDGHQVTVFEAARTLGGRARGVLLELPGGQTIAVDNGQHILIGAYADSLRLMRLVGVEPEEALMRLPMSLLFPDRTGLALPDLPTPLDAVAGILRARGWNWRDKLSLLRVAISWQRAGFRCDESASVADLCATLPDKLIREFIEPLCVSALNTPMAQASGTVFLKVLHDGVFSQRGGSNFLLPRRDLSALFPDAAARWLVQRGAQILTARRVASVTRQVDQWLIAGEAFDHVILATSASESARLLRASLAGVDDASRDSMLAWSASAEALRFQAIATVYAQAHAPDKARLLSHPILALRHAAQCPAQFVFDRDQISPEPEPSRLLAFVVSAHQGERTALEEAIVNQAQMQLGLTVQPLKTIIEKRATFACTPALARPRSQIASGLAACGDYLEGPYPATLEGAVQSGWSVIDKLR